MKKSDTIEFVTCVPGLHNQYPLEYSNKVKFNWMTRLNLQYKEEKKIPGFHDEFNSIRKCPGIYKIAREGFIYRNPWDLKISFENGELEIKAPWQAKGKTIPHYLQANPNPAIVQASIPGINRTIVKFMSPWRVKAPVGLQLLFLPIPYPDTYQFESCMGILDPSVSNEINPQVWWNKKEEFFLKAGTPMMQIIPFSDKKYNLVCREENDRDRLFAENAYTNRSIRFNFIKEKIQDVYNRYVSGDKM